MDDPTFVTAYIDCLLFFDTLTSNTNIANNTPEKPATQLNAILGKIVAKNTLMIS